MPPPTAPSLTPAYSIQIPGFDLPIHFSVYYVSRPQIKTLHPVLPLPREVLAQISDYLLHDALQRLGNDIWSTYRTYHNKAGVAQSDLEHLDDAGLSLRQYARKKNANEDGYDIIPPYIGFAILPPLVKARTRARMRDMKEKILTFGEGIEVTISPSFAPYVYKVNF